MQDIIPNVMCKASEVALIPAIGALVISEVMGTKKTGKSSLTALLLAILGDSDKKTKNKKRKNKNKTKEADQ